MTLPIEQHIAKMFGFEPSDEQLKMLDIWHEMFVEYNQHTNLMGKRDIPLLYNKHVLDSLAITLFEPFHSSKILLDVGTGGGFPSAILAIFFPDIQIYALDSVQKKINFLKMLKDELGLENFIPCASRVENFPKVNADIITSRAVGSIALVWKYSKQHLKQGGYYVSYKALSAREEAAQLLKYFPGFEKPAKFIPYRLPLKDRPTRRLVIFKKL